MTSSSTLLLIRLLRQLDPQWEHRSEIDDAVYPPETAVLNYTEDPALATCDDDPDQIDVLVLYTADARLAQGGTAAIEAWINDRISQTNSANANSLVPQPMNLVHMTETDFTPSGSISQDLAYLRDTIDIFLPEAHTLRDTYAADMVALVVAEGNNNAFRTLMAYNCPGGFPRINFWSNPDVFYQGQPMGIDYGDDPNMAADNARSMVETASIVANFRRACLQNPTPTATSTATPTSMSIATATPTNTATPEPTQTSQPTATAVAPHNYLYFFPVVIR